MPFNVEKVEAKGMAGLFYLNVPKKEQTIANKMGYVICRGKDCKINGRIHNAKVGD